MVSASQSRISLNADGRAPRFDQLYTEEKRTYYSNRLVWDQSEEDPRATMEPHVYEVSALAYKGLALGEGENQSILVSGESGAG